MEELLEQLKNAVHAGYISDLPHLPYRRWALVLLEDMPLGRFSLWEISAVASYLLKCRVSFSSYEAARHCFRMALKFRSEQRIMKNGVNTMQKEHELSCVCLFIPAWRIVSAQIYGSKPFVSESN